MTNRSKIDHTLPSDRSALTHYGITPDPTSFILNLESAKSYYSHVVIMGKSNNDFFDYLIQSSFSLIFGQGRNGHLHHLT